MGGADDEDIEDDEDDVVESANKGTLFLSSQFFLVKYNCSWIKPQIYAIMTNWTFWCEYWNFISILFIVNYLKLLLTE